MGAMGGARARHSLPRLWLWSCLAALQLPRPRAATSEAQAERNNWAVLVDTSRYWYNYRHVANVLSFYHTIKRLGIPDSQILLMLAEDVPCNPRNARPGTVFNQAHHNLNLYGEDVEVDYRGDEVSVENFLRLLTGRHPPGTPRSKRLLTDSMSNVFIFITGHSGDEFIKFQDWEEITSTDIADAFEQMHKQRRYRKIFWVSDTCQAATLQNQFYSPGIIGFGSSGKKENSYSHHVDQDLGIAIIDRFTYYALEFLNRLTPSSTFTIKHFKDWFNPRLLHSNPEMRSDLFGQQPSETLITEFLASTGRMRFLSRPLQLASNGGARGLNATACPAVLPAAGKAFLGWQQVFEAEGVQPGSSLERLLAGGSAEDAAEQRRPEGVLDALAGVRKHLGGTAEPAAPEEPRPDGDGDSGSDRWLAGASLLVFLAASGCLGRLL
uniref:GPI-anchor transamidase n=1 Tax=Alexandrium monilatum TaxID=311494 RepID=A0A6T1HIE2_9DINO